MIVCTFRFVNVLCVSSVLLFQRICRSRRGSLRPTSIGHPRTSLLLMLPMLFFPYTPPSHDEPQTHPVCCCRSKKEHPKSRVQNLVLPTRDSFARSLLLVSADAPGSYLLVGLWAVFTTRCSSVAVKNSRRR